MPTPAVVALEPVTDDVAGAVRRALAGSGFEQVVPRGAHVALKVNLGWDLLIPGSVTSPLFLEAVIGAIRPHVGRISVVESDQVLEDIEAACVRSGHAEVIRRSGVEWVNMSAGEMAWVDCPDNAVLKRIEIPKILQQALLITLPVMKTHAKTVITGALKNQWGCLSKMRHEYHLVLDDALADINSVCRPRFAIMDGTIGLEGNGPKSGFPKVADRILASADPVALDTVQALVMGIDPATVRHLATCAARGLGTNDPRAIDVRGMTVEQARVRFRPARHNAVSVVETVLRKSALKRLFFNTPIFDVCLWGAKNYYRVWTAFQARRCWDVARRHPVYGPQWRGLGPALGP